MFPQAVQYGAQQQGQPLYPGNPMFNPSVMGVSGMNPSMMWFSNLLWLVTWIAFIAVLVALARWLWKLGNKGR